MNNIRRLIEEIEDMREVLECDNKVELSGKIILQKELNKKEKMLNRLMSNDGQANKDKKIHSVHHSTKNKGFIKRKNLIKDKRRHGNHWISKTRNYALFISEKAVRNHIEFISKGAGYRKVFDVPNTIW